MATPLNRQSASCDFVGLSAGLSRLQSSKLRDELLEEKRRRFLMAVRQTYVDFFQDHYITSDSVVQLCVSGLISFHGFCSILFESHFFAAQYTVESNLALRFLLQYVHLLSPLYLYSWEWESSSRSFKAAESSPSFLWKLKASMPC